MNRIQQGFASLNLLNLPQLPYEVRGVEPLRRFARLLAGGMHPAAVINSSGSESTAVSEVPLHGSTLLLPKARLILIGGKGGVGKSSLAAATALELASRFPEKKVLIFSTNPAHSLSDSFGQKLGSVITSIKSVPNLYAQEIDAQKLLADFTRRYREAIDEVFRSLLGDGAVKMEFDQEVMERLLDLSPPGIDEVMAIIQVMELMERREFDIFVLDTAPTGHFIRFLEMPDIARAWLGATIKTILKYRGMAGLGSIAGMIMKYATQVGKLRKQLRNAAGTEITVITIPEAMGIVEMKRLLLALSRFKIPCRQIVINMVTPPNDCPFCSAKREEEQRYIREVTAQYSNYRVDCVPRLPQPICGIQSLLEFRQILFSAQAGDNSVPS